uniref:Uncharacterized protein n=1 Tax=Micrurus spixii TaxID=129469 RepID=A0A2D4NAM6_9SAUR
MSKYQHGHGFEANWQRSGDTLPFTLCQLILLKTFTVSKSKVNSKLDKEGLFLSICMVTLSTLCLTWKQVSVYLLCNKHSSFCTQLAFLLFCYWLCLPVT